MKLFDVGKTSPPALLPLAAFLQAACAVDGLDLESELGRVLQDTLASVAYAVPPVMVLDFRNREDVN